MCNMGENLSRLMEERGIKQAELCRMTGIPTSAMSHYVRGDSDPSFTRAIKLARALGVTTDELSGKNVEQDNDVQLTDDERELLSIYRSLSTDSRDAVMAVARTLGKGGQQ